MTNSEYESGLVRISAEDYFADPCAVPSLSSSIAHVIDSESPLHAWSRHPRLGGGVKRMTTKTLDNGSLSHALLLGAGKDVEVIDADDYRTNAAKKLRDDARRAGKIPALAADHREAAATAERLRERFSAKGIRLEGESEIAAFWTESAHGASVQCRGMMDHVTLPIVYDIKSIRSAHPDVCQRNVDSYGYAIQRAAYVSAIEKIRPDLLGRVDFVFVFYELEPPYAVTPVRLTGAFREIGERAWRRAVNRWEECLRTNNWPDYSDGIIELGPTPWMLAREEARQFEVPHASV